VARSTAKTAKENVKVPREGADDFCMSPLRRLFGIAALSVVILPLALVDTAHASTPTVGSTGTYTVKNGDYLVGIAGKLKVKLADLLAANNLTVESVILPGQQLQVPAGGTVPTSETAPAAPAAPATYTVQSGDFLYGIAGRMNVKPAQLLAANNLEVTSLILPGQKLTVPEGGVVPAESSPQSVAAGGSGASSGSTAAAAGGTKVERVVTYAQSQIGKSYKFFSAGPDSFDCSGLVTAAFKQVGITLPQYSGLQATFGTAVDWRTEDIRPGDLVFSARSGTDPTVISHVGIAVSSTQWVQAAGTAIGVKQTNMPSDERILAVRRLLS
jgi:LysM repeat protein